MLLLRATRLLERRWWPAELWTRVFWLLVPWLSLAVRWNLRNALRSFVGFGCRRHRLGETDHRSLYLICHALLRDVLTWLLSFSTRCFFFNCIDGFNHLASGEWRVLPLAVWQSLVRSFTSVRSIGVGIDLVVWWQMLHLDVAFLFRMSFHQEHLKKAFAKYSSLELPEIYKLREA